MTRLQALAALAALSASLPVLADTALDGSKSRIEAEFTQMGVPVTAPFTKFGGSIAVNAAKPAEARAHIEIDTASFDIGDEDYNAEVRKKEWFDSTKNPRAIFDATGFKPASAAGRFEAIGKLSIKGKTRELKVSFTQKTEGGASVYDGIVPVSRKDFDIGGSGWSEVVEDTVRVKFHIVVPAPH